MMLCNSVDRMLRSKQTQNIYHHRVRRRSGAHIFKHVKNLRLLHVLALLHGALSK